MRARSRRHRGAVLPAAVAAGHAGGRPPVRRWLKASLYEIVRRLVRLAVAIRDGDITPPWPCREPDGASDAQIEREFARISVRSIGRRQRGGRFPSGTAPQQPRSIPTRSPTCRDDPNPAAENALRHADVLREAPARSDSAAPARRRRPGAGTLYPTPGAAPILNRAACSTSAGP